MRIEVTISGVHADSLHTVCNHKSERSKACPGVAQHRATCSACTWKATGRGERQLNDEGTAHLHSHLRTLARS